MSPVFSDNLVKILILGKGDDKCVRLSNLLGNEFDYLCLSDPNEVMEFAVENTRELAIVFVSFENEEVSLELIDNLKDKGYLDVFPVIAFSTNPSEEMLLRAYEAGVSDFINLENLSVTDEKRIKNAIHIFMQGRSREIFREEYDSLTGTLNMNGLRARFERATKKDPFQNYVVIYSDIRNFKYFNYIFGYESGNELLTFWCEAIGKYLEAGDFVGRIASDQVIAVLKERHGNGTEHNFDKILEDVREHFKGKFGDFSIDIVSGLYFYNPSAGRGETIDEIVGYASEAQKTIKATEKSGCAFYDLSMWEIGQRQIDIIGHFEKALKNGEIYIELQPQYNYVRGDIIGAECLCRWNHETLGPISPGEFIPVLEKNGKIFALDHFVWEEACKYIRRFLDMGKSISLAVNVSRKDVEFADIPDVFVRLVKKYDIDPALLRVEITEGVYVENVETFTILVNRLSELGFTIEMDDFGSGFSSLNVLSNVDVDVLKLDMGFMQKSDSKSGSIINAIVKMAHVLGMKVLAEGVETAEQAEFLKNVGCLMGQGYYYSRPMKPESFEELLETSSVSEFNDYYGKYQLFNIQDLFDRKSSGFFLFNNCMGPAAIFDYDGSRVEPLVINDEFFMLSGWDKEEVEKNFKDALEVFSEKNKKKLRAVIEKCIANGTASGEIYARDVDKYISIFARHVTRRDGISLIFCEGTDISVKKNLEIEKQWYEKKLQALLEIPGVVIYEYNPANDSMILSFMGDDGKPAKISAERYLERLPQENWIQLNFIESYIATLKRVAETGEYQSVLARARFKNGVYHMCKFHFSPVMQEDESGFRIIGRGERVEESDSDAIFDNMPVGTFRYKADGEMKFDFVGANLVKMLGFGNEDAFRRFYDNSFKNFVHPDDRDRILGEIDFQIETSNNDYCEYRVIAANGEVKWLYDRGTLVEDERGEKWFYVAVSDLNEYKKRQQEEENSKDALVSSLKRNISRDAMTKVYNHEYVLKLIEERLNERERGVFMLVDVDDFKWINDNIGHSKGDEVLIALADSLKKIIRDNDIVGRYGGDEFVLYISGTISRTVAEKKAKEVLYAASQIMISEDKPLSVSVGVVAKVAAAKNMKQLVDMADSALYKIKRGGKSGYALYED